MIEYNEECVYTAGPYYPNHSTQPTITSDTVASVLLTVSLRVTPSPVLVGVGFSGGGNDGV